MYMSIEDIAKIEDPVLKNIATSWYAENKKQTDTNTALSLQLGSLRDKQLNEERAKRTVRVERLKRISPSIKADLDAMLALPSMALSMGEGGAVVDPMAQTLAVLEKGLSDLPAMLTAERTALSVAAQPTDETTLTEERADAIAEQLSKAMGNAPAKKAG